MQEEIKKLAEKHGTENLIVVLGINQLSTIEILARTFKSGDPSYAGPLAGVSLSEVAWSSSLRSPLYSLLPYHRFQRRSGTDNFTFCVPAKLLEPLD